MADSIESSESFDAGNFNSLRVLARLFLSPSMASAFNACCLKRQRAAGSPGIIRLHSVLLDRCRHSDTGHVVMCASDELRKAQPTMQARRDMLSTMATVAAASAMSGVPELRSTPASKGIALRSWPLISPAAAADVAPAAPTAPAAPAVAANPDALTREQIEEKLKQIPIVAVVNKEDSPYFTVANSKTKQLDTGFFYLDPTEAQVEQKLLKSRYDDVSVKLLSLAEVYFPYVRANKTELGGNLLLKGGREGMKTGNSILDLFGGKLDSLRGDVPLFYYDKIVYETSNGRPVFPFFMDKQDLDNAWNQGFASKKEKGEIPLGLVGLITVDQLVDRCLEGIDPALKDAAIIPSTTYLTKYQKLSISGAVDVRR